MRVLTIGLVAVVLGTGGSVAADVTFAGVVLNTCTLIATPGVLALSSDGSKLSSAITGGVPATVSIVSLGINKITVNNPTLTASPSAYNPGGQVLKVSYQGLGLLASIVQALTGLTTTFDIGILPITILQVNNEVSNSNGFPQGAYETTTVVTCS